MERLDFKVEPGSIRAIKVEEDEQDAENEDD